MNHYPPPDLPVSDYYYSTESVPYITPRNIIHKNNIKFHTKVVGGYGLPFITTVDTGEAAVRLHSFSGFNILNQLESSYKSYTTTSCLACVMQAGPPQSLVSDGAVFYHIAKTGGLTDFYNQMGYYSGAAAMLYNEGSISGTLQNEGSATGATSEIWNSGTLNIISNAPGGRIEGKTAAIINQSGGNIGNVINNGTLSGGQYAIVNQGRLGSLTNTGKMIGGIINYGNISGNIALGRAQFIFAGNNAKVGGVISWNGDKDLSVGHGSKVAVGNNTEVASYRADSSIYADNITVGLGSTAIISQDTDWHGLAKRNDALSNTGTIIMNNKSILSGNLTNGGTLIMGDQHAITATLSGDMVNSRNIILNPTYYSAGNTLTINGNYVGTEDSIISLGSVLAGDNSLTDKLIITGDTIGDSTINIVNEKGAGAQTLRGIQVVSVGGKSDGIFTLGNRVVAGAYDYNLHKGSLNNSDDNKGWYLTSTMPHSRSRLSSVPFMQDAPVDAGLDLMLRPEIGAYTSNFKASKSLFNISLQGRSAGNDTTSMWIQNKGGQNKTELSGGQNTLVATRYITQIGRDILKWQPGKEGRVVLGVMGGRAFLQGSTHNNLTNYGAKNRVNGYTAGMYGAWMQRSPEKTGLSIDSWLQHSWFNNKVKGDNLFPETYKSQNLSGSMEISYRQHLSTFLISKEIERSIWCLPHAQVTWVDVKNDAHTEQNGTYIQHTGLDGLFTCLGLRLYLNNNSIKDNYPVKFGPFVEVNWVYNNKNCGVRMNDNQVYTDNRHNTLEIHAGIEGNLICNCSVWASVTQQVRSKGYNDSECTLSLKYQF